MDENKFYVVSSRKSIGFVENQDYQTRCHNAGFHLGTKANPGLETIIKGELKFCHFCSHLVTKESSLFYDPLNDAKDRNKY